jgi:hypothetical protein
MTNKSDVENVDDTQRQLSSVQALLTA